MSVGRNGVNRWEDVRTVQILINLNMEKLASPGPLAENGLIGSRTIGAVEGFQRRVVGLANPDGRVDPNGRTLRGLREGMPDGFSGGKLLGIMIHSTGSNITKYYGALQQRMSANGINTPLRMAHFLAQIAHESAEFRYSEEIADGEAVPLAALIELAEDRGRPASHYLAAISLATELRVGPAAPLEVRVCVGTCQRYGALDMLDHLVVRWGKSKGFAIAPVSCLDQCDKAPACEIHGPHGKLLIAPTTTANLDEALASLSS